MTDLPTLRDRIRRAICEAEGFEFDDDGLEPDEFGEHADAVLAVLPAPVGLTEAERQFLTFALDQAAEEMSLADGFTDEDYAALDKFRRMADEAQQPAAAPPHDVRRAASGPIRGSA